MYVKFAQILLTILNYSYQFYSRHPQEAVAGPLAGSGRGCGGRGHADVRPGSLQHRRDRGLLRDHATVVHPAQRDPQQGAATRVKYKLSQSVSQQQLHFIIPLELLGALRPSFLVSRFAQKMDLT